MQDHPHTPLITCVLIIVLIAILVYYMALNAPPMLESIYEQHRRKTEPTENRRYSGSQRGTRGDPRRAAGAQQKATEPDTKDLEFFMPCSGYYPHRDREIMER